MTKAPLTRESESMFLARVEKLRADSPRKFGTMDTAKMLRHMRNAFETCIGETNLPDSSIPVVRKILYFAICHVMTTWPGGRIKAPDYWSPPADHPFDEEKRLFLSAMQRFLAAFSAQPGQVGRHPILGPLTLRQWSRLNGIHLHHHLRQFGV